MSDEWMPVLRLALGPEQFHQLPRNAAYKYELIDGATHLSPRPKHYHALLDLTAFAGRDADGLVERVALRRARGEDFAELVPLFAAAFRTIQPFGSLDDDTRRLAAARALERTRTGGDGPWIEAASQVALQEGNGLPLGAIFVTLLPLGDPTSWDSYWWTEAPPADCIERGLGRPHLTWIFVSPLCPGHGIGSALLGAAAKELLGLGFRELASTFMMGNESSMLWHWRNGFQLLPYPGSVRRMRQRWTNV